MQSNRREEDVKYCIGEAKKERLVKDLTGLTIPVEEKRTVFTVIPSNRDEKSDEKEKKKK